MAAVVARTGRKGEVALGAQVAALRGALRVAAMGVVATAVAMAMAATVVLTADGMATAA